MLIIKDILLQLLFVIVPVLLYRNVWVGRSTSNKMSIKSSMVIVCSSISVIFAMSFPVQLSNGMEYDLRSIPIIITILYAGYIPGILTILVMFIVRIVLGSDDVLVTILGTMVYAIIPFLLVNRWYGYSLRKKLGLVLLIGCLKQLSIIGGGMVVLIWRGFPLSIINNYLEPLVEIGYLALIVQGAAVYFIEFIRESHIIRKQVERSEKLNLISELAASVAHEVRNPLTVVRGFVQLLREETNPKNVEYIRLVLNELDRAEFIISDYLNLAKPHSETLERLEIAHTVKEVTAIMSSYSVMNRVEIACETEPGLFVESNAVKLKQALMNLMKNGIESMGQGGMLHVTVRAAGKYHVISIMDEGEGMTPEQIEQIGLPFYSTKEKGTGLGLMVTCRIIEAMQGTIHFQSQHGHGTQVTIQLPAVYMTGKGEEHGQRSRGVGATLT
ncbi:two-component sensor histidine kinase [Brevibacillus brevis]|uniref:ATP-binding protein n=1 Tax=Brevibacillus brevis TaxID=1393 RepID=UPI001F331221|nr:ATP-binding protein [Brevibacillus brevis]UIO41214.1 two-component sensor histidine kinase [Brevibacillus brevis]